MRILWRTLPKLALPAALGLGIAYMGTGFVPRPAPNLRPPEELRALGQAYDEESPVRAILERNVLQLETPVFAPLGQMPAPVPTPQAKAAPGADASASAAPGAASGASSGTAASPTTPAAPPQAAFAPMEPSLSAPHTPSVTEPLSGGPSVVGRIAPPVSSVPASQAAPAGPAAPAGATASGPQGAPARQPAPQKVDALKSDAQKPDTSKPDTSKPDAPKSDTAKAPAPSLAGIRLVGVIAGGDKPLAMLSVDGAALSLGVGGTVRGWTLSAVEPGQVVLKNGEHVRRLALGAGGK